MGSKKEKVKAYMSKHGREGRKDGMYKLESRKRKIAICLLFSISALVYLVFGAIHSHRAANANRINDELTLAGKKTPAYDECLTPGSK